MGLSFHCPQCSQAVPALPTQMGQQVSCPACHAQFRLSPMLLGGNGQSPPATKTAPMATLAAPATPPASPPVAPAAAPPVATVVKAPLTARPVPPPVMPSRPPAAVPAYSAAPPPVVNPTALAKPPAPSVASAPVASADHSPLTTYHSPAAPRPNVARFIATTSQDSTVQLTADGKLPELALAEATAKKQKTSDSSTSPLVLGLVLITSTLASILLLVFDFSGSDVSSTSAKEAREKIEQYYASQSGTYLPYQELLREAQIAHGQQDFRAEQEHYQRVRDMLCSESLKNNYAGLTGTRSGDEELMRLLGVLLDKEGRER